MAFPTKCIFGAYSARDFTSKNVSYRPKRTKNLPENPKLLLKFGFTGTQKGP